MKLISLLVKSDVKIKDNNVYKAFGTSSGRESTLNTWKLLLLQ